MAAKIEKLGYYGNPKAIKYQFKVEEWLDELVEKDLNIEILPKKYFTTTGEAIVKCDKLIIDFKEAYLKILTIAKKEVPEFDSFCLFEKSEYSEDFKKWSSLVLKASKCFMKARYLMSHFIHARGTNLFLETDWNEGEILCHLKNPKNVKL